jgi:hypothetical protein
MLGPNISRINNDTIMAATALSSVPNTSNIDLITRVLNNQEVLLNSVQLINFIHFYFDDQQQQQNVSMKNAAQPMDVSTPPMFDSGNQQLISICFPCIACSYKFKFEQTFHQHLDRRSILIRLYCTKCQTYKTFFNKCKLFYHIYSHKAHLLDPMYKQLQIELIPFEKMNQPNANGLSRQQQHQYLDLEMIFSNFDKLEEQTDTIADVVNEDQPATFALASFNVANLILNNRLIMSYYTEKKPVLLPKRKTPKKFKFHQKTVLIWKKALSFFWCTTNIFFVHHQI